MVEDIAKSYVSKNVCSFQKMIELKPDVGNKSIADAFHFDDWRHRFKALLYLTDVGEHNAPFVYLKGSHLEGSWRNKFEFEYFKDGRKGRHGYFFTQEVEGLVEKWGFEKMTCTAKKGTLLLVDTRGIHRGSTLIDGERMILANYFDVRGDF